MPILWARDLDRALADARGTHRSILIAFSAAPDCRACARLEAEVFPDDRVAHVITRHFIAVKMNIKEQPAAFSRFGVLWTPTLIITDERGVARYRFEGYLPPEEFLARLELGLAHASFAAEDFSEATRRFRAVAGHYTQSEVAPEALYWAGVSDYITTRDPAALREAGQLLNERYSSTSWAKKASVWIG